jgi:tetratricopeptide (TPR) repeat protein
VGGGGNGAQTGAITEEQLNQAIEEVNKAYRAAETDEKRLAVYKDFLARYPETRRTADYLSDAIFLIYTQGGDYDGAVAYAMEVRGKLSGNDASIVRGVDVELMELYGAAKRAKEFREIASCLDRQGGMTYGQYLSMLDNAVGLEAWDLVLDFCKSGESLANVEAFKSEHPQLDYTEEEFQASGRNRQGLLLTYSGWAKANLGRFDQAIADFAGAEGLLKNNYFGFADNELYLYWGKTLLKNGDAQGAIEKLAPAAFFGGLDDAFDPLKQAYLATGGAESGYEEFVWDQRLRLAKTVDDFTLDDYDGQSRRFSELRGKVTMLTFWFPT